MKRSIILCLFIAGCTIYPAGQNPDQIPRVNHTGQTQRVQEQQQLPVPVKIEKNRKIKEIHIRYIMETGE